VEFQEETNIMLIKGNFQKSEQTRHKFFCMKNESLFVSFDDCLIELEAVLKSSNQSTQLVTVLRSLLTQLQEQQRQLYNAYMEDTYGSGTKG
jgi:hypothetical protein